jgi:hypothetical protein
MAELFHLLVIPAKAGISGDIAQPYNIPAFAGMTAKK